MSKHRCPLCKRKGWKTKRRTWKLWREALKQGIPLLDAADSPAAHEALRRQISQEIFGDKPPPSTDNKPPGFREVPGDGDVAAMNRSWSQFFGAEKPLQPVKATPAAVRRAAEERRRQLKREQNRRWYASHPNYSRDYYQRKKAAAEAARGKGNGNNGH